jgi:hypothetical protein
MVEPPVVHKGPTEMMCVMVKFELLNWFRSSPKAAEVFNNVVQSSRKNNMPAELEDEIIDELALWAHAPKKTPREGVNYILHVCILPSSLC